MIDAKLFLTKIKALMREEIRDIAVKHKLMDRTSEKEPWEKEVKKKFFLNEIDDETWAPHEAFLQTLKRKWRKQVFLETAYIVLKSGDIIKLISGVNNSGKTHTSVSEIRFANWLFRNYWKVNTSADIGVNVPIKPFRMKENVIFYPDAETIRAKIAEGSKYNCIAVNEGMKAAINMRSWDPEVIDMILELFTERASGNYLTFEYQLTRRPPKLLISRFNVWEHKPSQKWMVLSIPSSVYRSEDPLNSKEIEKIKGDRKISAWLTHKSGNVNYITKMLAPKLKPHDEALFKKYRKLAKEEHEKGKNVKKALGNIWYTKLVELHEKVSKGEIAYMQVPDMIRQKYKFGDKQIKKFMADYEKYDRDWKLMHPDDEESGEVS